MARQTKRGAVRSEQVFQTVKDYIGEHGYPPSIREVCDAIGLSSTSSVHHHLIVLEANGRIERLGREGHKRWIIVKDG